MSIEDGFIELTDPPTGQPSEDKLAVEAEPEVDGFKEEAEGLEGEAVHDEEGEATEAEGAGDEYEGEALKYGWKPADKWRGDGHISAEKFMTRGAGAQRKQAEQIEDLQAYKDGADARLKQIEKTLKAAHEADMRAKVAEIKEQKRRAVNEADITAYDELDAAEKEVKAVKKQDALPEITDTERGWINNWVEANPAYKTDVAFQDAINEAWQKAQAEGITNVAEIIMYVDTHKPKVAPKPKPKPKPRPQAVDGGGVIAARPKSKKGWASLSAEDKKTGKEFILDGTFKALAKEKGISEEEAYAMTFYEQEQ